MCIIKTSKNSAKLRKKAEKRLNTQIKDLDIPIDVKELIHELQIHQIELEIQNEELKSTQLKLQSSQGKYLDLYNFAPTAYFTLDDKEQIKDVNLAGAALLGLEKNSIIDKAFIRFIDHDSLNKFYKLIKKVIITNKIQKSDLNLLINLKSVPTHIEINSYNDINGNLKSFLITVSDMSELKKAEQSLKESEQKFKTVADYTYDWEYWVDSDGNLIYVSPSSERVTGYSPDEFLKDQGLLEKITHPDDISIIRKHLSAELIGEEHDDVITYRIINKQGEERWIDHGCQPVYSDEGMFLGRRVSNRDISELKKIEEDLRHSNEWISFAQHSAKSGFWDWDMVTEKLKWSNELYELFGLSNKLEASFEIWLDLIHPDDRDLAMNNINHAIEEHEFLENEYRIIRSDGKEVWISALGSTVYDNEDKPQRMSGICLDISKQKLAEENLLKIQDNLKIAMDLAKLVHWEYDVDSDMFTFDDDFYDFYGTSADKEGGYKMSSDAYARKFIPPADLAIVANETTKSLETDDPNYFRTFDHKIIRTDGKERYITVRLGIIKDDQGRTIKIYGVNQDITERKKTEMSLEKLFIESEYLKSELSTLIENIVDEVWFCDLDGNIRLANAAARKFEQEIDFEATKSLNGLIESVEVYNADGKLRSREGSPLLRSLNGEILADFEEIVVFPFSGRKQFRQVSSAPIKNEKGEITGAVAVVSDITRLKEAENKLKESEGLLRGIFNNMPSGMSVYQVKNDGLKGSDYIIKEFNQTSQQIEGMKREDVVGRSLYDIRPNIDEYGLIPIFKKVLDTGEPIHYPAKIYVDEKFTNWYENYVFKTSTGEIVSIYNDVTEQVMAKEKLKKSLDEKDVLLREVHHRVKNNMQIISSLLNLQSGYVGEEEANILKSSQMRVKSMAMVHEKLYHSSSLSKIGMSDYIQSLVSDLFYSYIVKEGQIKLITEIENIEFNIETAIPCGLIINELVSNSLKHAFPNERKGNINISLKPKTDQYELIIMDDGIGLSKDFELKNIDSLGLQLVNSLIHQLEGEMEIDHNQGTKFIITFKESDYKKRFEER